VTKTIHIAAALIDDGDGRVLLVRKAGTHFFMQAGGKLEAGEDAWSALQRELWEEIGLSPPPSAELFLGQFTAIAANEPDTQVTADLSHVRVNHTPTVSAEIAEALWIETSKANELQLAPLTRDVVIPLALQLNS
jgi:8-oxo-dGTP diphosphatase